MTEPQDDGKEEKIEPIETESENSVEKLQAEVNEWKDKYFRALAEMENTRKRLQREKIESQSFAVQNVIVDFLQPLDHFSQAIKHTQTASQEIKHWGVGLDMILNQFLQVLGEHGAQPFNAVGQMFDPHQHEAIETEETTRHPAGIVIEEFVRGYKIAGRVIRPAKVKVATQPVSGNGQKADESTVQSVEPPKLDGN